MPDGETGSVLCIADFDTDSDTAISWDGSSTTTVDMVILLDH